MKDLLDVEPKEDDFECKEEFPGTLSIKKKLFPFNKVISCFLFT